MLETGKYRAEASQYIRIQIDLFSSRLALLCSLLVKRNKNIHHSGTKDPYQQSNNSGAIET